MEKTEAYLAEGGDENTGSLHIIQCNKSTIDKQSFMLWQSESHIQGEDTEEIDYYGLFLEALVRVLDDFALLNPNSKDARERHWFREAKDWLFGEPKPLLKNDGRNKNFTIYDIASFFFGTPDSIRKVALFMRRFNLDHKKFYEAYYSRTLIDENENKDKAITEDRRSSYFHARRSVSWLQGFGSQTAPRVRTHKARSGRAIIRHKVTVWKVERSHSD